MTTPESLNALADRVEREEPSRELDGLICQALWPPGALIQAPNGQWCVNRFGSPLSPQWEEFAPSACTTSLDSAVALVPEGASVNIGSAPWRAARCGVPLLVAG